MAFKRNDSNINRNGRPKGSENKDKKEIRKYLNYFLKENQNKFETEFNKLEGIQFVSMFVKLLEYSTPKLNRVDLIENNNKQIIKGITFIDD